jgi:hypothetical protein
MCPITSLMRDGFKWNEDGKIFIGWSFFGVSNFETYRSITIFSTVKPNLNDDTI